MKPTFTLIFALSAILLGCNKPQVEPELKEYKYLHFSHSLTNSNPEVVPGVESFPFHTWDLLLLGGDIGGNTSDNISSMQYYDNIFDLGAPTTLWSVGNHDYANPANITAFTNRPSYYAYHHEGITFIVLNTEIHNSKILGSQLSFLQNTLDTMEQSSHCVVLHHKLIWMPNHPELEPIANQVSNGDIGNCPWCLNPQSNFYTDIYPHLIDVQNRGIEVLVVGGDAGRKVGSFQFKTIENIQFLASGLSDSDPQKSDVIIFHHYPQINQLEWEIKPFVP